MASIVVMNRFAAVIAADSAYAVDDKVLYGATKIFKLSDKYPVAVTMDGNSGFMCVPIELLINKYREYEGEKDYNDLQGYVDNFIEFLNNEQGLHDDQLQHTVLRAEIRDFYDQVQTFVSETSGPASKEKYIEAIHKFTGLDKNPGFRYSFEKFKKYAKEDIDALMEICKEENLPIVMRNDWEQGVYDYLCLTFTLRSTFLTFVGYGTDDIYPSAIRICISGITDGILRYVRLEKCIMDIGCADAVLGLGGREMDMSTTVTYGIFPQLREKIFEWEQSAVRQTQEKMIEALMEAGVDDETIAKVRQFDAEEINDQFCQRIDDFRQEFNDGLCDRIALMEDVEEMANMAELLMEISKWWNHMNSEENVGGAVNVAVLTRDRGFVWMKHHDWVPSAADADSRKYL